MKQTLEYTGTLTLQLTGPFSVTDESGVDFTPRSRKAQALLALIATSTKLRRSRTWLQDKLWSQNDAAQGSANLRQTLTTLRKTLGPYAHVLEATRLDVALSPTAVEIAWNSAENDVQGEFLEGLDVSDPEFETWLRVMRGKDKVVEPVRSVAAPSGTRWKVVLQHEGGGEHAALVQSCVDMVARVLREQGELEITEDPRDVGEDRLVSVYVNMVPGPKGVSSLRLVAQDLQLNRQIWAQTWSGSITNPYELQDLDLLGMIFQLQSELSRYMAQSRNLLEGDGASPLVLGAAIPRIFSFQPEELDQAALMLSDAMDSRNAAQFLGWQAQIAVINLIEQFTDAPEACVEQGKMLAAKAIEMDPMNSVVLSTAANAQVLLDRGDASAGGDLAKLAVQVNPANPLAWWAYANVAIYAGKTDEALKSARVASRLAARTPLQFWCDFQLGLAAFKAGDFNAARRALETSASLAPQFRPPRRYLLAIYANEKEFDKAARVLVQLKKLEPGFSLDHFVNDPNYPISLVRKRNMLSWNQFQHLSTIG
ncbi:hypothetical protein [Shimia marina]|uniref:hypothetical protein n=1 Tax=Shimia marina TaxID=321267 RepID=UPI00118767C6|nr:hypothetical protein [Shimia marina]